MEGAKNSAAGLDQWTPGDLMLLPGTALDELAKLLNLVRSKGSGVAETDAHHKSSLHVQR